MTSLKKFHLKKKCFPYVFLRFPHFGSKTDFLMKCLDDSAWLCLEKLKKINESTGCPRVPCGLVGL